MPGARQCGRSRASISAVGQSPASCWTTNTRSICDRRGDLCHQRFRPRQAAGRRGCSHGPARAIGWRPRQNGRKTARLRCWHGFAGAAGAAEPFARAGGQPPGAVAAVYRVSAILVRFLVRRPAGCRRCRRDCTAATLCTPAGARHIPDSIVAAEGLQLAGGARSQQRRNRTCG